MTAWLDRKYIGLLSPRLEQFKWQGEHKANCRCPICGDSEKNKTKKRGYFLVGDKNEYYYMCHNCHFSSNIGYLIKQLDPTLYKDYRLEVFKNAPKPMEASAESVQYKYKPPVFKKNNESLLDDMMPRCTDLPDDHVANRFLTNRMIPEKYHGIFYYLEDFSAVKHISNEYKNVLAEPRLVIPFYDGKGRLTAIQGRALTDDSMRYITVKINSDAPLVFGMDRVDLKKIIWVVEGPFDSLFLDNSIAVAGSALKSVKTHLPKEQIRLVFDNQPRNSDICKLINRSITEGFWVTIWPPSFDYKDINDMVMEDIDVHEILDDNTYQGLTAQTAFNYWKKLNNDR